MTDINNVVVVGRLTKDVNTMDTREFSYLPNNVAKMNFSIAVNRSVNRNGTWQEETSFFNVELFGKLAEGIKNYMKKGTQICVTGSLKQERWQDKQTNQNRERIVINAESIQLLGTSQNNQNQQGFTQQQPQQQYQQQPAQIQQNAPMQQVPQQQGFTQNQNYVQQPMNNLNNFPEDNFGAVPY